MRVSTSLATLLFAAVTLACGGVTPPSAPAQPAPNQPPPAKSVESLPGDVADVTWEWVSMITPVETIAPDRPESYTIRFERAGRLSVRADCNRGGGTYSVSTDRRLMIGPIALTRVGCPPGSLSERFGREVGRASSYFQRDGALFLELPVDSGTLRFRRQG
jgi:heat shock protein HslJ